MEISTVPAMIILVLQYFLGAVGGAPAVFDVVPRTDLKYKLRSETGDPGLRRRTQICVMDRHFHCRRSIILGSGSIILVIKKVLLSSFVSNVFI